MLKKIPLYLQIVFGLVLGVIWALLSSWLGMSAFTHNWIAPFGTVFIAILKLIAIPLILFSIIGGIVSLGNPKYLGKMGVKALGFYLATTVLAVSLGLIIVNLIKPGNTLSNDVRIENRIKYESWADKNKIEVLPLSGELNRSVLAMNDSILDKTSGAELEEDLLERLPQKNQKKDGPLQFIVDMIPTNLFQALSGNGSMLQIIFFAIFFGVALLYIDKERANPVIKLVDGLNSVFVKMIDLVMLASPLFVFALMAGVVGDIAGDNPKLVLDLFKGLSWYSLSVLIGLLTMAFVLYPLLLKLFKIPIKYLDFLRGISPAQALAFSTSSSAATLPVTMECVEENLKVNNKTASFVLPIGATVNMDGTSLYQAVAVLFLAQMHMIDLNLWQQLTVVLTATLASIGSAAIPSAGLVMLMVVLQSVGLNPAWIAVIMPVDRILDMVRTVVNVTGDATVCLLVDKK